MTEIMDAITDDAVREITFMKPTRIGGTEALIDNTLGYIIEHDPGPTEIVFPSKEKARKWSKTKLDPMIRDTECLTGKLHPVPLSPMEKTGRREKSDEILFKTFDGGFVIVATGNSEHTYQMDTIRYMMLSDLDDFPVSVGTSGNPVDLARNRLVNYRTTHKFIKEGHPKIEGSSLIAKEYETSDKSHYYVRCPGCAELSTLLFSYKSFFRKNNYDPHLPAMFMVYDKEKVIAGDPLGAWFVCETCGTITYERGKMDWLKKTGIWIPEKKHIRSHRGFHVGSFVSPWMTWTSIAADWITSVHNRESRQVVINTKFAETFERDEGIQVRTSTLAPFVEKYEALPAGVALLVAATDVQDGWLKTEIIGFGVGEEIWQWDVQTFEGSPGEPRVWKALGDYHDIAWPHALGFNKTVDVEVVDTHGHFTNDAYKYVRDRLNHGRTCYGIRGRGGEGIRLLYALSRKNKEHIPLWTLGVDSGKEEIMDRLRMMLNGKDQDGNPRQTMGGPRWMHFRDGVADETYFDELTSEIKRPKRDKHGFVKWVWEKKLESRRNEALDLRNYCLAAREMWRGDIKQAARRMQRAAVKIKARPARETEQSGQSLPPQQKRKGRRLVRRPARNPFGD